MKDKLLIATAYNNEARIYVSYTKQLSEDARITHKTWPTATVSLGRLLTATAMMSFFNKDDSSIIIKLDGDGPLKSLEAQSLVKGELRATLSNPEVYLKYNDSNKHAVGKAIGNGTLSIIKNMGLKSDYRSTTNLVSGEIADDLTYYFTVSEQTPSSVGLGVLIDKDQSVLHAGGFIIQLLPNASEDTIVNIEKALTNLPSITNFFNEGNNLIDLLILLSNNTYKLLEEQTFIYKCPCNKDYYYSIIKNFDESTLNTLITEDEGSEIICHYCKNKFYFTKQELKQMLVDKKKEN